MPLSYKDSGILQKDSVKSSVPKLVRRSQRKSSLGFGSVQTAFIFLDAIFSINELTVRAFWGQIWTHLMQEIHRFSVVFFGLFRGIAPTGQAFAQSPQRVHFTLDFGFMGTPWYSR